MKLAVAVSLFLFTSLGLPKASSAQMSRNPQGENLGVMVLREQSTFTDARLADVCEDATPTMRCALYPQLNTIDITAQPDTGTQLDDICEYTYSVSMKSTCSVMNSVTRTQICPKGCHSNRYLELSTICLLTLPNQVRDSFSPKISSGYPVSTTVRRTFRKSGICTGLSQDEVNSWVKRFAEGAIAADGKEVLKGLCDLEFMDDFNTLEAKFTWDAQDTNSCKGGEEYLF